VTPRLRRLIAMLHRPSRPRSVPARPVAGAAAGSAWRCRRAPPTSAPVQSAAMQPELPVGRRHVAARGQSRPAVRVGWAVVGWQPSRRTTATRRHPAGLQSRLRCGRARHREDATGRRMSGCASAGLACSAMCAAVEPVWRQALQRDHGPALARAPASVPAAPHARGAPARQV